MEVGDDVMLGDAQDIPAECRERAITRAIEALAAVVRAAIDLDDQTDLGAGKSTM